MTRILNPYAIASEPIAMKANAFHNEPDASIDNPIAMTNESIEPTVNVSHCEPIGPDASTSEPTAGEFELDDLLDFDSRESTGNAK